MTDARLILNSLVNTSVAFNGVMIPYNQMTRMALRYCEPFLLYNEDYPDFPISRRGSSLRARIGDRYVLYATNHQLTDYEASAACIINPENLEVVTCDACRFSNLDEEGAPIWDLRMYSFSEAVGSGAISSQYWLDIRSSADSGDRIEKAFAVGYPHLDRLIDYERRDIPLAPRAIFGSYLGPSFGNYHAISIEPTIDYNPDGISGGPVFGIVWCVDRFVVKLIGLTTRAGQSRLNFFPVGPLMDYAEIPRNSSC